jgi:hypothetical protein
MRLRPERADGLVDAGSAEACRNQAEQLARQAAERGACARLVDVTEQHKAIPAYLQMHLCGYAVTERVVEPKGKA